MPKGELGESIYYSYVYFSETSHLCWKMQYCLMGVSCLKQQTFLGLRVIIMRCVAIMRECHYRQVDSLLTKEGATAT